MSGLDDLLKGLSVFNQGVTQFATARAVHDANDKLAQTNLIQDEKLRAQEQAMVGQDLNMRLIAAGQSPGQAAAATQNIGPSAGAQYAGIINKETQDDSQAAASDQAKQKFGYDWALQQQRLDAMGMKDDKKIKKLNLDQADKFYKTNQKQIETLDQLDSYRKVIKSNPSRLGVELAKRGLIAATGDSRVSDEDLVTADNDPTFRGTIARRLKLEITGEDLKDKQKFYNKLLDGLEQDNLKKLDAKISGHGKSLSELDDNIDSEQFSKAVRSRIPALSRMKPAGPTNADKIARMQAYLSSPMAKTDPAKAAKVTAEIARLKSQGK